MKKEYQLFFDLIYYFILPILIWEFCRGFLSDYAIILVSVFPGILYSFYRFFNTKDVNFTRMYLFSNIIVGLISDLFAGSAIQLLWNDAYYSLGLSLFFWASCFTKRPLFFYFSLDILVLQGYDRKLTRQALLRGETIKILRMLTLFNSFRELIFSIFLMKVLPIYGVEIYTISILLDQLFSFIMSSVLIVGYFYLYKHVNKITVIKKLPARKIKLKLPKGRFRYLFENSYFFLRKHFR
jgi:hypothetical protein